MIYCRKQTLKVPQKSLNCYFIIYLVKKVPRHEIPSVAMATTEVKNI